LLLYFFEMQIPRSEIPILKVEVCYESAAGPSTRVPVQGIVVTERVHTDGARWYETHSAEAWYYGGRAAGHSDSGSATAGKPVRDLPLYRGARVVELLGETSASGGLNRLVIELNKAKLTIPIFPEQPVKMILRGLESLAGQALQKAA
jgi:hypothetical protein